MKSAGMTSIPAALLACLLSACSSGGGEAAAEVAAINQFGSQGAQSEDHAVCPTTVASAMGEACDVEGLVCYPQYPCGETLGQATCQCADGHFTCQDQLGAPLVRDASPGCPAPAPSPLACPATMTLANFTACTQAGEVCTYANPCTSIPEYVDCPCVPEQQIDGGAYLAYECPAMTCLSTADAGSAGSPVVDATVPVPEAGSVVDASTPDAASGSSDARAEGSATDATGE
jgi:hypothetical protein